MQTGKICSYPLENASPAGRRATAQSGCASHSTHQALLYCTASISIATTCLWKCFLIARVSVATAIAPIDRRYPGITLSLLIFRILTGAKLATKFMCVFKQVISAAPSLPSCSMKRPLCNRSMRSAYSDRCESTNGYKLLELS